MPKENSVIGLVGRNGIGKTTITKYFQETLSQIWVKNEEKENAQKQSN